MTLPTIGTFEGTVVGAASASIHGDVYHDLLLWPADTPIPGDEAAIRAGAVHARVPAHLCARERPGVGARVRLSVLLGQVTGVEVRAA